MIRLTCFTISASVSRDAGARVVGDTIDTCATITRNTNAIINVCNKRKYSRKMLTFKCSEQQNLPHSKRNCLRQAYDV